MKIRSQRDTVAAWRAGVGKGLDETAGAERAAKAEAVRDTASIAEIPPEELSPKVRSALDKLMAEVGRLKQELDLARQRIAHLEELADQDPLLAVLNRRAFVRELTRIASFIERYGGLAAVIYIDLNKMKAINDRYGHGGGDAALHHVATILTSQIRASDFVARLGGDEFGVILAQADEAAAHRKAAQLVEAITCKPVDFEGQTFGISISYGVHTMRSGDTPDHALLSADRAMYTQKKQPT